METVCQSLWTKPIRGSQSTTALKQNQATGLEMEMFAYDSKTFAPLGIEGSRVTSGQIIQRLAELIPQSKLKVDDPTQVIVGLELSNGSNFSLEPGGQIEFSSRPCKTTADLRDDVSWALERLAEAGRGEVVFLEHGTNPAAKFDHPLLVPKQRYKILDRYLKSVPHGRGTHMMRHSATVQPNLDVFGDNDWSDAVNLCLVLTPFARHLFSNSKYFGGKRSSAPSERQLIWQYTDKTRSGIPSQVAFHENIACSYANWSKAANVFLIPELEVNEQPLFGELSFNSWLESGYKGIRPKLNHWETHLGTVFPDLRLRGFLEVRSTDAQSFEHLIAASVFWSVALQSRETRLRLWEFLAGLALGHACCQPSKRSTSPSAYQIEAFRMMLSLPDNSEVFKNQCVLKNLLKIVQEAASEDPVAHQALVAYGLELDARVQRAYPQSGLDFVKQWATLNPHLEFLKNVGNCRAAANFLKEF